MREFLQMKVLVINAGSSSLKYQLLDTASGEVMAKGLCERIGIDGVLTHTGNHQEIAVPGIAALIRHGDGFRPCFVVAGDAPVMLFLQYRIK